MKRTPTEKLPCPVCGCRFSRVADSRGLTRKGARRIRTCEDCGTAYETIETVVAIYAPPRARTHQPRRLLSLIES